MGISLKDIKKDIGNEVIFAQEKEVSFKERAKASFERKHIEETVAKEIYQQLRETQSKYSYLKEALLIAQQDEVKSKSSTELPLLELEMEDALDPDVILVEVLDRVIDELEEAAGIEITNKQRQLIHSGAKEKYRDPSQKSPQIREIINENAPELLQKDDVCQQFSSVFEKMDAFFPQAYAATEKVVTSKNGLYSSFLAEFNLFKEINRQQLRLRANSGRRKDEEDLEYRFRNA